MKKRKKIPKFKSRKEEAKFWSTHSPLDYPDEFREVKKPFQFEEKHEFHEAKKRNVLIQICLLVRLQKLKISYRYQKS